MRNGLYQGHGYGITGLIKVHMYRLINTFLSRRTPDELSSG